jgi:hypothetical protein
MNKALIQSLAEQASIDTNLTRPELFATGDSAAWREVFAEMLAELILEQATELVAGYYDERTMQWAGPRINQYFGIE